VGYLYHLQILLFNLQDALPSDNVSSSSSTLLLNLRCHNDNDNDNIMDIILFHDNNNDGVNVTMTTTTLGTAVTQTIISYGSQYGITNMLQSQFKLLSYSTCTASSIVQAIVVAIFYQPYQYSL